MPFRSKGSRTGHPASLPRTALLAFAALSSCSREDTRAPTEGGGAETMTSVSSSKASAAKGRNDEGVSANEDAQELVAMPTAAQAGTCSDAPDERVGVLVSPQYPVKGQPLRVMVASLADEAPLAVRLEDGKGTVLEPTVVHAPGVPTAVFADLARAPEGKLRVVVGRDGTNMRCETVDISKRARSRKRDGDSVWPVDKRWNAGEEALFSAWVRALFHAPPGDDLAWTKLDEVTSDPKRNVLHDHLQTREDDPDPSTGLYLKPDCADTPYFLRAYFAWKRGLPFGFRQCSRGGPGKAPRCGSLHAVPGRPEHGSDSRKDGELGIVQQYFRRTVGWGVHSGNGRSAFGDDDSDFYPVALSRRGLRPGTIYADPYGHIFVLVELFDPRGREPGILYAIDGQPDGSITRKRFWEGNFLWNPDPALGGSGFKAFRPLLPAAGGGVRPASDAEIRKLAAYGDISDEQAKLDANAFYDTMDALITPGARDAFAAQEAAVQALFEAAKVRVTSVDNAQAHFAAHPGATIDMPVGHAIFETTGAWENFSTPARDLRLLIAIDLVQSFADKVARNAEVYVTPGANLGDLRKKLDSARERLLDDPERSFEYTRSDGSKWKLSVRDLVTRSRAFEIAYNPNDCPEVRWGAAEGSEELSTCRRRAPVAQREKMTAYRAWFSQRRRPARGETGPNTR